jgi:spermidine synthase
MNILKRLFAKEDEKTIKTIKNEDDTLSVAENNEEITLKINNIVYSRLNKKSLYTGSYWDYFAPLPMLYPHPKIAMIGLGGGTILYQLTHLYKKINIDAIEINTSMVELSKFFLREKLKNVNIITEDGSKYIKRIKDGYDILILDAYERDHIPDVFLKEKFIEDAFNALKDDGVMAINYALNLSALVYLDRYTAKLKKLFNVYTINNPFTSGNMIILCSKKFDRDQLLQKISANFKETGESRSVMIGYRDMSPA